MVHKVTELMHVRVATDTITSTPNHPFRVAGRGWVAAGELAACDTLYLADGGCAGILSVMREKLATPVDVYNVEVEGFHTYFVAGAGVWVHNCGGSNPFSADSSAMFEADGALTQSARLQAQLITQGSKLGNTALREALTSDGSSLADWGKYQTQPSTRSVAIG